VMLEDRAAARRNRRSASPSQDIPAERQDSQGLPRTSRSTPAGTRNPRKKKADTMSVVVVDAEELPGTSRNEDGGDGRGGPSSGAAAIV